MSFKAFRIHQQEKGVSTGFEQMEVDDLTEGDVVVRVAYSGINFKDALAATGKAKILRVPNLNGGIDFSGTVESSENARFSVGDRVLVCGCGLSETRDGGYSQVARVPAGCFQLDRKQIRSRACGRFPVRAIQFGALCR